MITLMCVQCTVKWHLFDDNYSFTIHLESHIGKSSSSPFAPLRSFALLVKRLTDQNISIPRHKFFSSLSLFVANKFFIIFFWLRIQNVLLPSCLSYSTVLLLLLLMLLNKYISLFYLLTSMGVFHHTHKFFFIIVIISGSLLLVATALQFFYDISFALNIYIVRVSSDQFVAMSHAIIFGHLFPSLDFGLQLSDK